MSEGLITSKDYDLNELLLISSSAQSFDLRYIFAELQIYQDMFSSVMSGVVIIKDGNDIFNGLNLSGYEYIKIDVDKPGLNEPIRKVFRIYKATNRTKEGNSAQRYTLHFCSDELPLSLGMKISKGYKETTISDIVDDIVKNYLKIDQKNIALFDATDQPFDLVIPNQRPLEAIQWAAARAYNEGDGKQCYFFFENARGFNFVSLQSLYKKKDLPKKEIKVEITQLDGNDPALNKDSAMNLRILNDFDSISAMMNGALSSRQIVGDIFEQKVIATFNSYGFKQDVGTLNPYLNIPGNIGVYRRDNYPESYAWEAFLSVKHQSKNLYYDKWVLDRALHMAMLNNFKIKVILPGDTGLNAGDIVFYDFQKFVAPDDPNAGSDEYRSGNYIVTSVNHKFTEDKMESIVELSTDSYATEIPAPQDLRKLTQEGYNS